MISSNEHICLKTPKTHDQVTSYVRDSPLAARRPNPGLQKNSVLNLQRMKEQPVASHMSNQGMQILKSEGLDSLTLTGLPSKLLTLGV